MATKKRIVLGSLKPVARQTRVTRRTRVAKKVAAPVKPTRKLLTDKSLFGALPDMSGWALPLLKELRNE